MAPIDVAQSLENLKLERDAIVLYDGLAAIEKDARRADAFRMIAGNERRHADIWADKLRAMGAEVPPVSAPRMRIRTILVIARVFGTHAVRDLVKALEGDEEQTYNAQATPEVEAIAADEREHAAIWQRLSTSNGAGNGTGARPALETSARTTPAPGPHPAARPIRRATDIASGERWHRAGRSGTMRAIIFGVSDGLVSNLALVMGVAGASGGEGSFVLLAGIAGLLAGAFSMAAGEYISMQSQRELFERQIALERAELEAMPEEEQRELALVYQAKGFTEAEANTIAARMFKDPEHALDTLIREELGLDPDELGSSWGAAGGSFVAFAIGAVIPVVPYLLTTGSLAFWASCGLSIAARMFKDPQHALDTLIREELGLDPDELGSSWGAAGGSFVAFAIGAVIPVIPYVLAAGSVAFWVSIGLSVGALFAVGAGVSLLTGRSLLFSGGRQVLIGAAAAIVTYVVGNLIGVAVG